MDTAHTAPDAPHSTTHTLSECVIKMLLCFIIHCVVFISYSYYFIAAIINLTFTFNDYEMHVAVCNGGWREDVRGLGRVVRGGCGR